MEHVFGFMEQSMNGLAIKSVGIKRATAIIGLINLTYRDLYKNLVQIQGATCLPVRQAGLQAGLFADFQSFLGEKRGVLMFLIGFCLYKGRFCPCFSHYFAN